MVRIAVDLNRCQGYAQCAFLAPDVFAMHGEEALLYVPEADEEQREQLARAVAACPVQAILVDALDVPAEAVSGAR
ncbi:ferredoxin [Streptomyces sp. HUAS 31]|uniref:ferredoxin n=1 Tax=Streptomyces TaxID=1883 RepID=UPI002305D241|nr:ferredoxin [Streptomyces sp. HUAS 31]WCE00545.1 ferredoxin [Streptomyces sp. HUAS 31]